MDIPVIFIVKLFLSFLLEGNNRGAEARAPRFWVSLPTPDSTWPSDFRQGEREREEESSLTY